MNRTRSFQSVTSTTGLARLSCKAGLSLSAIALTLTVLAPVQHATPPGTRTSVTADGAGARATSPGPAPGPSPSPTLNYETGCCA
ncbi:MAG: hypothetical protein JWM19_3895 [Actinomycetia bacterium]|nr:hypothetical protein [Actinomycetes bacterium]